MRSDNSAIRLAVAVAFGLAIPAASPAAGLTMVMPLCGGGSVTVDLGRRPGVPDPSGACHAGCAVRRDDDEFGRPGRIPQ